MVSISDELTYDIHDIIMKHKVKLYELRRFYCLQNVGKLVQVVLTPVSICPTSRICKNVHSVYVHAD